MDAGRDILHEGEEMKKLIEQAKYACCEACVVCDNHCPKDRLPRKNGCDKCHVGKLIEMIKEIERNGVQGKR